MSDAEKQRILIVDDDPDIVLVLSAMLEDAGYEIATADRGDELEHLHEGEAPDLILLDLYLSGLDGRQIARRLKGQEATRRIPILMLSAHPTAEQEALAVGADGFLAKPFDLDVLLATVAAFLR
jgi:DNA-binding response OmpR family regulator